VIFLNLVKESHGEKNLEMTLRSEVLKEDSAKCCVYRFAVRRQQKQKYINL
jgi:hypothetical protein